MTKKDYELIATVFSEAAEHHARQANISNIGTIGYAINKDVLQALERFGDRLADELQRKNPRFNKGRFLKACGID